jgi:hypothetical protein
MLTQSMPLYISLISTLILSPYLRLVLPILFPSCFFTKNKPIFVRHLNQKFHIFRPLHSVFDPTNNTYILWGVFFSAFYILFLRPKYTGLLKIIVWGFFLTTCHTQYS